MLGAFQSDYVDIASDPEQYLHTIQAVLEERLPESRATIIAFVTSLRERVERIGSLQHELAFLDDIDRDLAHSINRSPQTLAFLLELAAFLHRELVTANPVYQTYRVRLSDVPRPQEFNIGIQLDDHRRDHNGYGLLDYLFTLHRTHPQLSWAVGKIIESASWLERVYFGGVRQFVSDALAYNLPPSIISRILLHCNGASAQDTRLPRLVQTVGSRIEKYPNAIEYGLLAYCFRDLLFLLEGVAEGDLTWWCEYCETKTDTTPEAIECVFASGLQALHANKAAQLRRIVALTPFSTPLAEAEQVSSAISFVLSRIHERESAKLSESEEVEVGVAHARLCASTQGVMEGIRGEFMHRGSEYYQAYCDTLLDKPIKKDDPRATMVYNYVSFIRALVNDNTQGSSIDSIAPCWLSDLSPRLQDLLRMVIAHGKIPRLVNLPLRLALAQVVLPTADMQTQVVAALADMVKQETLLSLLAQKKDNDSDVAITAEPDLGTRIDEALAMLKPVVAENCRELQNTTKTNRVAIAGILQKQHRHVTERDVGTLLARVRADKTDLVGLLPVGAKIHFAKAIPEEVISVLRESLGLDTTSFSLQHAGTTLILPPSSRIELNLLITYLGQIGLFYGELPNIQITICGRWDEERASMVGASTFLATDKCPAYKSGAFSTKAHNKLTGARIMAYDDCGKIEGLPYDHPSYVGRTDMLGRVSALDIQHYQVVGTISSHNLFGGYFADLYKNYKAGYDRIVDKHGLKKTIGMSNWVYDTEDQAGDTLAKHETMIASLTDAWLKASTEKHLGVIGDIRALIKEAMQQIRAQRDDIIAQSPEEFAQLAMI